MICSWITQNMGLLQEDPTTNILQGFPLEEKKIIVSSVVKYYAQKYEDAKKQLKTHAHMNWVMEVIGVYLFPHFFLSNNS